MQQRNLSGRSVCIVDDDDIVRRAMCLKLKEFGILPIEAATGADLIRVLEREHVDCILLDQNLDTENGLFIQDQLRERFVDVPPVIILSNSDNYRTIIKAFRSGVYDYLIKRSLHSEELLQSVTSAIHRQAATASVKAEVERLRSKANTDETTGLLRPEAMKSLLRDMVEAPPRLRKPFLIVFIRIDGCEEARLQMSQVAWKRMLGSFATRLRKMTRSSDLCGHWDGNSFIYVVDTEITRKSAALLVDRLNQGLMLELQSEDGGSQAELQFGTARCPSDASTLDALFEFAQSNLSVPGVADADVSDGETPETGERRQATRQRVYKGAKIVTSAGRLAIDCTIRDLSSKGARIRLSSGTTLPDFFEVQIAGIAKQHPSRLVWQRGEEIGVEFSS